MLPYNIIPICLIHLHCNTYSPTPQPTPYLWIRNPIWGEHSKCGLQLEYLVLCNYTYIITPLWVVAHAPCMHLQCSVWLPFMPWYRSFIATPQGVLTGLGWMLKMVFECVLNVNCMNGWGRYGGLRNCTQDLHTFNALLTSWNAYCMVESAYTQGFWCWC